MLLAQITAIRVHCLKTIVFNYDYLTEIQCVFIVLLTDQSQKQRLFLRTKTFFLYFLFVFSEHSVLLAHQPAIFVKIWNNFSAGFNSNVLGRVCDALGIFAIINCSTLTIFKTH